MREYNVEKNKSESKIKYDLNSEEPRKKKHRGLKALIILMLIMTPCAVFGGIMYRGYVRTNNAYAEKEKQYTELAMSYVTDEVPEDPALAPSDEYMQKKVNFEELYKKEKDIYAWILIPDTPVNYPVLQSGKDKKEDYWLNHNFDGSYGYPGTIFTEKMFGKDFKSFNTVIYGHNMKNQTMFGGLHNFSNKEYFESHPYVYVYIQGITYKYEIVCASTVSDVHLAVAYNGYNTEQQRQQFIDYLKGNAEISNKDVATGIYENYITLSTCTHSDKNRFIILAKCVDKVSNMDYD